VVAAPIRRAPPVIAAVMGAGAWGTAFAATLADAGTPARLWTRGAELLARLETGVNPIYLPGVTLPPVVRPTTDPYAALAGADLVVLALPAQTLRDNLGAWGPAIPADALVLSLAKGIELGTAQRMSEVVAEVAGVGPERLAVLSGPNLAPEIGRRQPAATVVASRDLGTAERISAACATASFRPIPGTDVVGTELGGAVKNIVALAVGMAEGMGMGDNTKASIVTRGLAETARLGVRLGADPLTFMGLAGVGDLIATCMSPLSRNRTFGENLGRGTSVADLLVAGRHTAEGVTSCRAVLELASRSGLEMPIAEAVAAVIDGRRTPREIVELLMSRSRKHERV
jgi:glycerol-3-phosphate dehydrogenase (NAD(P)+)